MLQIGFTPLRWACMYGHKEAAQILLEADARDDLHSAAARGDTETVEEMLSTGWDANTSNRGDETPLMWAANRASGPNHIAVMKLLLQKKAKPDARDQHGFTALMGASQKGNVDAIRTLVAGRADVNAREPEDDETALMMAMHCARSNAVTVLLELGAEKPKNFEDPQE